MATEFFQEGPVLPKNTYESDSFLRSYLKRVLPPEVLGEIEPGLKRLGARAGTDLLALSRTAEAEPPVHIAFDPWGKRIDELRVSPAWTKLDQAAAEEGIVATGYQRKHGAHSRVHQFARLYLYMPSSAYYACPLAMTDGAARAIELYGDEKLKAGAYTHLTSMDPKKFWTSGQWMTERTGGSDVSGTETIAKVENGRYRLYGTKWFTSATTSQVAMTLARIEGAPAGGKGLSFFYLEPRLPDGRMNDMIILRLKDKLGTRSLPTAEVQLQGTEAVLLGEPGNGVKKISSLFNITRMYNACSAVTSMRRALDWAQDYSTKRVAFKKKLTDHPLHLETLAQLEVEYCGGFLLAFRLVELLGKDETGKATPAESAVLRLLTPIAKLYTGKQVVSVVSEVLECFGGAGYCEDTGMPRLLRDAQTLAIWEGTTNVLSLDCLRAIEKENALPPFLAEVSGRIKSIRLPELASSVERVKQALGAIEKHVGAAIQGGPDYQQAGARQFAYALARTYSASLFLEHAQWSVEKENSRRALQGAIRWCAQDLAPLHNTDPAHRAATRTIALG